jgi:hypothetical protein
MTPCWNDDIKRPWRSLQARRVFAAAHNLFVGILCVWSLGACGVAIALSAAEAVPRRINTWEARLGPGAPAHPICRGVEPFTIKEELYWRIRFRDDDPRLLPILKTVALGQQEPQTVAWAVERADDGRGFGFTGGHFFAHWENEAFRRLMVNAILWTAKADVRDAGSAASAR